MKNHSAKENSAFPKGTKKVDISRIYNGELSEIVLDFALEEVCKDSGDYEFEYEPSVHARVYEKARGRDGAEGYIVLDLKVEGKYTCQCARCAKELTKTLCIDETYGITRDEDNDSEDCVIAPNGVLDAEDVARSVFYLSLPQRELCKEDCLGLCPVCGIDLNGGTCSCNKTPDRGNRMTVLKKLLDNYEEK